MKHFAKQNLEKFKNALKTLSPFLNTATLAKTAAAAIVAAAILIFRFQTGFSINTGWAIILIGLLCGAGILLKSILWSGEPPEKEEKK